MMSSQAITRSHDGSGFSQFTPGTGNPKSPWLSVRLNEHSSKTVVVEVGIVDVGDIVVVVVVVVVVDVVDVVVVVAVVVGLDGCAVGKGSKQMRVMFPVSRLSTVMSPSSVRRSMVRLNCSTF